MTCSQWAGASSRDLAGMAGLWSCSTEGVGAWAGGLALCSWEEGRSHLSLIGMMLMVLQPLVQDSGGQLWPRP